MTPLMIKSSIITYLFTTLTGEKLVLGEPQTNDPLRDGSVRFLEVIFDQIQEQPARKVGDQPYDYIVTIDLIANSRHQTDQYDADKLLNTALAALRNATIDIKDYFTTGEPTVGTIRFREETLGHAGAGGNEQWTQVSPATITGWAKTNV